MAMPPSSPPNPPPFTAATPRLSSNPPPQSANKTPIHHHSVAAPTYSSHRQQPYLNYQNIAPRVPQISKAHEPPPAVQEAQGILYPLASSGRGFLPKPTSAADQPITMANPGGFPPRSYAPNSARVPYGCQTVHLIRPPHMQHSLVGSTGGVVKGIPVSSHPKAAASPSSVSDTNGYKDTRDRNRDDSLATVRDRKVRIIDGASLYAQCRSWLRNGFPEESQPQYVDGVMKSLPRPLPMAIPVVDAHSPEKKEGDNEEEPRNTSNISRFQPQSSRKNNFRCSSAEPATQQIQDEEDVDYLSPEELLQRHIKRAKKVRARLREERLQRIARYKTRLALLLPPIVEQQIRNDTTAAGN